MRLQNFPVNGFHRLDRRMEKILFQESRRKSSSFFPMIRLADFDEGSDQISNHSIEKAVPLEGQLQNTALFFDDPNGANRSHGRFALVSRVGGKGREVVFPGQNLGGFA